MREPEEDPRNVVKAGDKPYYHNKSKNRSVHFLMLIHMSFTDKWGLSCIAFLVNGRGDEGGGTLRSSFVGWATMAPGLVDRPAPTRMKQTRMSEHERNIWAGKRE